MSSNPRRYAVNSLPSVVPALLLAICVALPGAGCGSAADDAPELAEAYGKITIDGAPAQNVRVAFVSTKGSPATLTDGSGNYTIEYNDKLNGAFPGLTTVAVVEVPASDYVDTEDEEMEMDDEDDDADYEIRERQQAAAPSNKQWEIKINVTMDGAPYDFELKSADAGKTIDMTGGSESTD